MAGEKDNLQENEVNESAQVNADEQAEEESKENKKYLGFEKLTGFSIRPGQTEAESIEEMKALTANNVGDEKLFLEGLRLVKPDYAITPEDEAQRAERRQLSQQAREAMFKFIHHKAGLVYDLNAKSEGNAAESNEPKKVSIVRGIDMLYDYRPGKEAEEHNKYVQSLFAVDEKEHLLNGTIAERSEMMKKFIDEVLDTDFDKLYHMTDREVAENFLGHYRLYVLCVEGSDSLRKLDGTAFNLTPEYREKLAALKTQHQGIFSNMKARFDAIANPNYEIFHYERMYTKPGAAPLSDIDDQEVPEEDEYKDKPDELEEALDRLEVGVRIRNNIDAKTYFDVVDSLNALNLQGGVDKVNQHIRKLNIPEDQLRMPYRNAKNDLIVPTLLEVTDIKGKKVSDLDLLNGDLLTFTDPVTKEKHFLKSNGVTMEEIDVTRWPKPLNEQPAKLAKMLDDADPWYIRVFTGSDKFKDMKKAARRVQELRNKLPDKPDAKQREELSKALEDLEKKTNMYLDYKGDVTRHTKETERARINAAKAIQEFAKEGRALVKGYENNLEVAAARAYKEKFESPEKKREDAIWDRYQLDDSYDRMGKLGSWIMDSLDMMNMAGQNMPDDPLKVMAMMVTFDLVMRERQAKGEGEPRPIETQFLKAPQQFLKDLQESETLQKMAEGMNAKGFQKFVDEAISARGLQKMSNTVLQEAVQKQQEALRKEQEALQKQQEALQKQQQASQVQQPTVQQTAPEVQSKDGGMIV